MRYLFTILCFACLLTACGGDDSSAKETANKDATQQTNASEQKGTIAENNTSAENSKEERRESNETKEEENSSTVAKVVNNSKEPSFENTSNPSGRLSKEENTTTKPVEDVPAKNTTKKDVTDKKIKAPTKSNTKPNPKGVSHDSWDQLMRTYVSSSGKVNYSGLKGQKSKVDAYLTQLGQNPPESGWSNNKEMAYWINLYNAFTISIILENYPVNSITNIAGGKVWTTNKIYVSGKAYTLDQIEKQMLLKKFGEPRVHFAVNCAAKSCPPLLNAAWTESNIQYQYDARAKAFINNAKYNEIESKKIAISKIFDWYASDFGGSGNIITYLNKYSTMTIKSNAKVSFKEYDWSLNN